MAIKFGVNLATPNPLGGGTGGQVEVDKGKVAGGAQRSVVGTPM